MTAAQILGAVLIALPFVAIAMVAAREMGWWAVAGIFAATAAAVAVIYAGTYLLTGGAT